MSLSYTQLPRHEFWFVHLSFHQINKFSATATYIRTIKARCNNHLSKWMVILVTHENFHACDSNVFHRWKVQANYYRDETGERHFSWILSVFVHCSDKNNAALQSSTKTLRICSHKVIHICRGFYVKHLRVCSLSAQSRCPVLHTSGLRLDVPPLLVTYTRTPHVNKSLSDTEHHDLNYVSVPV